MISPWYPDHHFAWFKHSVEFIESSYISCSSNVTHTKKKRVIFPHFFCFQIPKSSPGAKQLARIRLRSSQRRAGAALCDGSPRSAQEPRCRPNTEPSEPRGRRGWVIDGLSMFIPWFTGFQPSWNRGAGFLLISMDIADIASCLSTMTVIDNIHVFTKLFWWGV